MELRQKIELRRLLVPQLTQSLKILALPLPELKMLIEEELLSNPFLEEITPKNTLSKEFSYPLPSLDSTEADFRLASISKKISLQDVLLRQLGMFTNTEEEFKIGEELIGNIDDNGYLQIPLDEAAKTLNVALDKAENTLKLIQKFEPMGVGARTLSECLLIQLESTEEKDPLLVKIIECHLDDVAKKNYSRIAKTLKEPQDKIESLAKKILRLNPKPGRNYSSEEIQRVIPDIVIDDNEEDLEISINNEDIPTLNINKTYREMLKKNNLQPQAQESLKQQLHNALELLRAISKRKFTLRRIVEAVVEIQQDAIRNDLSHLKPLTFDEIAKRLNIHQSTVCRAVMNKYIKLPLCGTVALKNLFSSHIYDKDGQSLSSNHAKRLIKELIDREDKKHPLSDQQICEILAKENNLTVSRRTVAKYREELKILSTAFRRER